MNYFQLLLILFGVMIIIVLTITIILYCAQYCENKLLPKVIKNKKKNDKNYDYRKTDTGNHYFLYYYHIDFYQRNIDDRKVENDTTLLL